MITKGSLVPMSSERDFGQAMLQAGIPPQGNIIPDGKIHRFPTGNKGHKDGWCVFYGMAGAFGDWSRDIHEKWSVKNERLTYQDKEKLLSQIKQSQKSTEEERIQRHEETASLAVEKWNSFLDTGSSPYLTRKKVSPFGVRFKQNYLIIPVRDIAGKLWSLQ